ncbi:MAG: hypothetical protein HY680_05480 [Chloroflexi bacterium]|nr:hypothetical protein [Chloroflexota bacterium]
MRALQAIKKELKSEAPFVMTVFNPISVAGRLVQSEDVLLGHLRQRPEVVHAALEAITETFRGYVAECLNAGADGIFFATTSWASHDLLNDQEYQEFGRPYDLRVLEAARDAQFNILHVCPSNNMLKSLANYPHVHAINWDDGDATNPNLSDARALTGRALLGGVSRDVLRRSSTPDAVAQQVRDAMRQTDGRGFMLGPSCSISPRCPRPTCAP